MIPTRLGLNKINKEYFFPILEFFKCPLNVGIIGGRPNKALYFVGTQKNELIYLDPHYVQQAVKNLDELTSQHLTYHCGTPKRMSLSKVDTTLAFGFLLKDQNDFRIFCDFMIEGQHVYNDDWPFSILNKKPDYMTQGDFIVHQNHLLPPTLDYCQPQKKASMNLQFDNVTLNYLSPQKTPIDKPTGGNTTAANAKQMNQQVVSKKVK